MLLGAGRRLLRLDGVTVEYRLLGRSGFKVPSLSFGTATFGGGPFFQHWGTSGLPEAKRVVDICLDAGVNMFDTADIYSSGQAEEILGKAIAGRRTKVIISTKASLRTGRGPNDIGSSRHHLNRAVDAALGRLGTDYIDIFHLHEFDPLTPVVEVLQCLDNLIRTGKVCYVGVSNFAGWQLMKSLGEADRWGLPRYVSNQAYYSLVGREYEWELMPLGMDQGVSALVWSPLGWGRLGGKVRRGRPLPKVSRLHQTVEQAPPVPDELVFRVVDALEAVAKDTGRSISQIALNWVINRPTVASVIMGARDEEQLKENLGALGWILDSEHNTLLEDASAVQAPYPHWHQRGYFQDRLS